MSIRLIAIDIDGTLLDSTHQVPEANARAIASAVAAGIEVALVTGRRYHFALPIANQVSCDLTMILNNGALIKSKSGEPYQQRLLPVATARRILDTTQQFRENAAVMFDRPKENQVLFEHIDWENPIRKGYLERNRECLAECKPLEACLIEDPIQVMFSGPTDEMRRVQAHLATLPFANEFSAAITEYPERNFNLVDVLAPGVSKGAALADWSRRRGYAREEVMAIGDNLNDVEMLEFAGLPIVMANASKGLKGNGWRVTLSNDDCGVAHAIQQFAL
ncbi:MAG: HAD family hydrolase [Acidobacteria bacterium]|nr:HAD family hydrolase [Acidobacteriota bacterium]